MNNLLSTLFHFNRTTPGDMQTTLSHSVRHLLLHTLSGTSLAETHNGGWQLSNEIMFLEDGPQVSAANSNLSGCLSWTRPWMRCLANTNTNKRTKRKAGKPLNWHWRKKQEDRKSDLL